MKGVIRLSSQIEEMAARHDAVRVLVDLLTKTAQHTFAQPEMHVVVEAEVELLLGGHAECAHWKVPGALGFHALAVMAEGQREVQECADRHLAVVNVQGLLEEYSAAKTDDLRENVLLLADLLVTVPHELRHAWQWIQEHRVPPAVHCQQFGEELFLADLDEFCCDGIEDDAEDTARIVFDRFNEPLAPAVETLARVGRLSPIPSAPARMDFV